MTLKTMKKFVGVPFVCDESCRHDAISSSFRSENTYFVDLNGEAILLSIINEQGYSISLERIVLEQKLV